MGKIEKLILPVILDISSNPGRFGVAHLTSFQYPTDFANDRLIAAQVCLAIKNEAKIIAKVVASVFALQLDWKANNAMSPSRTSDQPPA